MRPTGGRQKARHHRVTGLRQRTGSRCLTCRGQAEPGAPHYYRVQGPQLLLEWDNTQRGANHAHSVWRDPEADFGLDVLAQHRDAHHAGGSPGR